MTTGEFIEFDCYYNDSNSDAKYATSNYTDSNGGSYDTFWL